MPYRPVQEIRASRVLLAAEEALRVRVLRLLLDGKEWSAAKIGWALDRQNLGKRAAITTNKLKLPVVAKRTALQKALDALLEAGLVRLVRPARFQITALGRRIAKEPPSHISSTTSRGLFAGRIKYKPAKADGSKKAKPSKKLKMHFAMGKDQPSEVRVTTRRRAGSIIGKADRKSVV